MYDRLLPVEKKLIHVAQERPELRQKIAVYLKKAVENARVVFVQAVISENDRMKIKSWISSKEDTPDSWGGWDIKNHHMTLDYFGPRGTIKNLEPYLNIIGKNVSLNIVGYAIDNRGVALLIDPPSGVPVDNKYPHITFAVRGESPKYSNVLLEQAYEEGKIIPANLTVNATIGWFDSYTKKDTFVAPKS